MRIGIDARMIDNTGIGRYLRNLLIHLARKDTHNDYIVFINRDNTQVVKQRNFTFVPLKIQVPLYSPQEQYWLPIEIRKWKLDLMHYPNFDIPLIRCCPYVVTIHDLIYYLYPEQCPSKVAHYYARIMLRYATKHARRIITDSEYSKQDLIKYFQISADKIHVIFPAAETEYFSSSPTQTEATLPTKYRISPPYILYVGKHHPYKNITNLLHAYTRHQEVYQHFQLVIAGKRDSRQSALYQTATALDPGGRILFTDFVPENDLFALYRNAHLFVFPSFYEGFGLPPLEAMACGVPVITSHAASLPEVVGDAAIQIDPTNIPALADAMRAVLTDPECWEKLRNKGYKRAQQFSWETAAIQLMQIYHNQGKGVEP
jgi:glycosyltransferase involved in cell wall biosynthesis